MAESEKSVESVNEIGQTNKPSPNEIARNVFRTLTDSAIIISIITALLYFVSFFYLKGFYSYYGLIDIEIDFSIFRILKTCLDIFQKVFPWILIYSFLALGIAKIQKNSSISNFFITLWMFLLFLIFVRTARYSTDNTLHIAYTILAFALIGLFIIAHVMINLLPDKITDKVSNYLNSKSKDSLYYVYKVIIILNSLMIITNFIPNYGFNEAKNKKDYLYDSTNQRVLIYQDNEKSVFIPKSEDDTFEKKYMIVSSAELSELVFEHYEKEVVFAPKRYNFEETPNIQDKEMNNSLTEDSIEQNSQIDIE